jgi:hypothetical protein
MSLNFNGFAIGLVKELGEWANHPTTIVFVSIL